MKLTTIGAAIAAAVLTVGLASTAAATTPTPVPPPTPECGAAIQAVLGIEIELDVADELASPAAQALKDLKDLLPAAEAALAAQIDKDNKDGKGESPATVIAREALAKLKARIVTAEADLKPFTDRVTEVKARLDAAVKARDTACKPVPGPTGPSGAPGTPAPRDLDCDDFANRFAAQVELEKDRSDPHRLDANKNGLACEEHFAPAPPAARHTTVVVNPPQFVHVPDTSGGIATGDGSLA